MLGCGREQGDSGGTQAGSEAHDGGEAHDESGADVGPFLDQLTAQLLAECDAMLACPCTQARQTREACVAERIAFFEEELVFAAEHSLLWDDDCAAARLERANTFGPIDPTQRRLCFAKNCPYFVGTLALGSECVADPSWNATTCGHEFRCSPAVALAAGACERVCPGPGDLCGECPDGYACAGDVGFFCTAAPMTGQPCLYGFGEQCAVGDYCEDDVCVPRLPPGTECDPYSACTGFCEAGVCAPPRDIGDPCPPDQYRSCAPDLWCSSVGVCEPWQCGSTAVE